MQKIFLDTREMDALARTKFSLSEELMMENAAAALQKELSQGKNVLILCGSGNNGADGYALARRLAGTCSVTICALSLPKSPMCLLQSERAKKCSVKAINDNEALEFIKENASDFTDVVDCIFGSGFHGELPANIQTVTSYVNSLNAKKIACDVPTGIDADGKVSSNAFCAQVTVTTGALKKALYSSEAKDFCGSVILADLGIGRPLFEEGCEPCAFLLEQKDLVLPHRRKQNVNKGSFGHVAVVCEEKTGAALIAGKAAFHFGAGLVTLVNKHSEPQSPLYELMTSCNFPANTTAVALGMGLGRKDETSFEYLSLLENLKNIPCVLDADIFYSKRIKNFLENTAAPVVLTPHPKEFSALLENCGLGKYSVKEITENAFDLVKKFCMTFKNTVLLLKGASVLIGNAKDENFLLYVNNLGTNALSKGGSGDVLSGMIAALLAQGESALSSAINASLAHALASAKASCDYSLTPDSLIALTAKL